MGARYAGAGILSTVAVMAALAGWAAPGAARAEGAWSQRVQVLYDAGSRTVARTALRAWDAEPGRNLEFTFEPAPGSGFDPAATGGVVEGRGKLVWRVRGSAAYDGRAVHSTYVGELKEGRPHGAGRLERRDGEVLEGDWIAGRLHGRGMRLDAAGNRYSGGFVDGRPHGHGRQAMADGSIYEGGFRDGRRHGEGRMRLPGGTAYASVWREGVEAGGARPDPAADAMIGGLLRAQSGGGDAGKVDLSVIVDQRMTQQSELRYTHVVLDEAVEIYPENPGMVEAWIGEAAINDASYMYVFDIIDWEDAPAFVMVRFETRDGSRVGLEALELQVDTSQTYRKPFLSTVPHWGCVGFRPSFSFQNNGWGPVRDARLSVEFFDRNAPERASRGFELDIGGFDQGADVSLRPLLDQAGVDTATLAGARFTCSSEGELPQCRQRAIDSVAFGELESLLSGTADLTLGVRGRIAYRWADDHGDIHDADEAFEEAVHVAMIETELLVAEGGDGWGVSPEPLRYQTVRLSTGEDGYVVDLPVRGNRNLAAYTARLKVYADEHSYHRFQAVARFADGSVRRSKPVSLFYMRPREYHHAPPEPAAGCHLMPEYVPHKN